MTVVCAYKVEGGRERERERERDHTWQSPCDICFFNQLEQVESGLRCKRSNGSVPTTVCVNEEVVWIETFQETAVSRVRKRERERESSGIGRVTSCVMLIAGWDVRERRRRKWDARSRRWAVTRERVWWPASQQQQPRCSVAHAHLNYISSGETLRKENRVRRPEGKQRERERERRAVWPFYITVFTGIKLLQKPHHTSSFTCCCVVVVTLWYLVTNLFPRACVTIFSNGPSSSSSFSFSLATSPLTCTVSFILPFRLVCYLFC